ncbi:hypothetical protein KEM48_003707 [Puccinia striiformis f. sp. tritici PST-130]|nr:hypothetical protein KEM48_003707 [Puccinia striiformis f. sp. tritici PST-130]
MANYRRVATGCYNSGAEHYKEKEQTVSNGSNDGRPHNLSSPTADTPPQSPTFPASFRQFHIPSRLTATVTQSPPAAIPQSPSASVPQSPPTGITRTNAIRRRPRLDLNDIKINGDLVNRALGLTSNSNSSPAPIAIRQIPPMKPSLVNYSTLPLPPLPHPSKFHNPPLAVRNLLAAVTD